MRTIDLAQLVGVSTQQIRNYVDAGVLPETPRSPAGYRQFDRRHARALVTYRALGPGFGWDGARRIMRAVHADDVAVALLEVNAAHAARYGQRQALAATRTALESLVDSAPPPEIPGDGLRIGEVAGLLRVRTSALRVWEAAGLLTPRRERGTGYRVFDAADLRDARMVGMLRDGGYLFDQIRPILDELRRAGGTEALRTALTAREQALHGLMSAMLAGASALHAYLTDAPTTAGL